MNTFSALPFLHKSNFSSASPNVYNYLYDLKEKNRLTELGMPEILVERLFDILENYYYTVEDIEALFDDSAMEQQSVWIREAYIGGNPYHCSKMFSNIKKSLLLHSGNYDTEEFENLSALSTILLHDSYKLVVLERLELSEMQQSAKSSEKNNATSLVLLLCNDEEEGFQKVIFPGDATAHTMAQIVQRLQDETYAQMAQGSDWVAPHHGSFVSADGYFNETGKPVLNVFLNQVCPSGMYISAGYENAYGHPHIGFVEAAWEVLQGREAPQHQIYINRTNERKAGAEWSIESDESPLYTQYTGIPAPYNIERANGLADRAETLSPYPQGGTVSEASSKQPPDPGLFFRRK